MLPTTLFAALSCYLATPTHALGSSSSKQKKQPKDAILLSNVDTLTLRGHGARTTHRRVPSLPQLTCLSHPSLCRLADIDVMRCSNQGSSYADEDIEWSCSAVLPEEVRLGSTDVICEGYSSADDPYVLKGSCAVEYRLALTDKGEARYPDLVRYMGKKSSSSLVPGAVSSYLFVVFFLAVLFWILYSAWSGYQNNNPDWRRRPRRGRRWNGWGGGPGGGGGGGGGGFFGGGYDPRFGGAFDDNNDPPPPYPGQKWSSSGQQQQQGWRPGFWSGLAAGAAGGYAAGGRNNWGSSRRGNGESSSSASGAGPSGRTYSGTGFGSTRRR